MKRILAVAMAFEAFKLLVLFVVTNYLPETRSEFLNAVCAMTLWLLLLPEMIVSYEQGPHGILTKVVMFSAGTIANMALFLLAFSMWKSEKQKRSPVADL